MKEEILKEKMKKMWKDVFHDTQEYVDLVFEYYFDFENVCYRENDGELIAMMLCVPYEFSYSDIVRMPLGKACIPDAGRVCEKRIIEKPDQKKSDCVKDVMTLRAPVIRGLYLCGLAVDERRRGEGLMTEMIEEANRKAYIDGYDFTFLIPASKSLFSYYMDRCYKTMSYRLKSNFTNIHKFIKVNNVEDDDITYYGNNRVLVNTDMSIMTMINYDNCGESIINRLYEFYVGLKSEVNRYGGFELIHDRKDFEAILKEGFISNGRLYIAFNYSNISKIDDENVRILGFAIMSYGDDEKVVIPHIYYNDIGVADVILQSIKDDNPEYGLSLFSYPDNCDDLVVKSISYVQDSASGGGDVEWGRDVISSRATQGIPYAMGCILNPCEILKFACAGTVDSKFSILVKSDFDSKIWKINSQDGQFGVEEIDDQISGGHTNRGSGFSSVGDDHELFSHGGDRDYLPITLQELASVIWRPKVIEDFAGTAFGIPRIPFNLCYMLD